MHAKASEARRRSVKRKIFKAVRIGLAAFVVSALALVCYFLPPRRFLPAYEITERGERELRVHFLSVGQGDCTIVEFPDGALLLIDAGDGGFRNENKLIRYIRGLKFTAISYLVTHADSDHYGGVSELLRCFGGNKLYLPALSSEANSYEHMLLTARRSGCETSTLSRYGVIENESGAYLVCLSPYSSGETDENESSAVLYLSYQGVNFLFCGDISSKREERLATESGFAEDVFDSGTHIVRLNEVDVLKVSHHGSAGSSSDKFLEVVSPSEAVISCGQGNSYSHPAGDALERIAESGAEIYRTDELGDVIATVLDGAYTITTR